jgi:hypothetical protein
MATDTYSADCARMSRSVTTVAETGGRCALVVFENPWIHRPAEQTTVELMAMAAARATEREVKRTGKVDYTRCREVPRPALLVVDWFERRH